MDEMRDSLLQQCRVLDLTDEKGFLCGKLLGDMGADVIKIEIPGGDPSRNIGPFYKDEPHPEKSLYWFAYNANKRGITLNFQTRDGKAILNKLVETSNVILESFQPGYMEKLGISYNDLQVVNPRIIMTSITPFGQSGPYSHFRGSDLVCWAMGGMMYLCGDPDRAPLQCTFPQAYLNAAAEAVVATMLAIYHVESGGMGQHADVSAQACVCDLTAYAVETWEQEGVIFGREGTRRRRPTTGIKDPHIWRCKDGHVHFVLRMGKIAEAYMPQMVEWLEQEGLATEFIRNIDWGAINLTHPSQDMLDQLYRPVSELFLRYTKEELYREILKRGGQLQQVSSSMDILKHEQLEARGFWENMEHPELGEKINYPGMIAKLSEASLKLNRRAPLIGEHNEEIYCGELGLSKKELVSLKETGII